VDIMTWREEVEAAVDAYKEGCYALSEGTSPHDDATYAAARAALLALVTDGRCLGCGGSVTYVNFGKGLQRLCNSECGWTDEDTND